MRGLRNLQPKSCMILPMLPRRGKFIGTEAESTGYQGLGQGVGSYCLLGLEFLLGRAKTFGV